MKIVDIDISDERVSFVEAKPSGWAGYVPVKQVRDALADEGIPVSLWPPVPSDNKCLERAMQDLRGTRNLVRPLPKSRGWSLVLENAESLDLEKMEEDVDGRHAHVVEITAKVERAEDDTHLSSLRITPPDHPAVPMIKEAFAFHRGTDDENPGMYQASMDLSVWFSQTIIPWVRGVATRARGGSYYVIKGENLSRLQKVARVLDKVSTSAKQNITLPNGQVIQRTKVLVGGRIILKPEFSTKDSVEILIDSFINECDKTCDELADDITNQNLGLRALETRAVMAEELQSKMKELEELLGVGLQDARARINEIEAGVGMARLKLEANK